MQFDAFIANRLRFKKSASFTKVIVRVAVVAVGISLAIVLLTSSLIRGFKEEIRAKVFGFWGHIHITHVDSDRSVEAVPMKLTEELVNAIHGIDRIPPSYDQETSGSDYRITRSGISHIQRFINIPALMYGKEDAYDGIFIKGVGDDFNWTAMEDWLVDGQLLETSAGDNTRGLLISQLISDRLQLDVGDFTIINFIRDGKQIRRRFQIRGIYNSGLQEYDRKFVLCDITTLQELLSWQEDQVSGLELFVEDINNVVPINQYIYIELLPPELYSETIRSRFPTIFEWLELQDINEWVLMVILTIVAFINMVTVLIILILERTTMIGVLKALGSRNFQIRRIFLRLALRIVIGGLVLANILALGLGIIQQQFRIISLNEKDYYLNYAPVHFDPLSFILINTGAAILILALLVIPAMLVNRIDPVKALRFK
jgi:lipoprotein-releasing system permease protein